MTTIGKASSATVRPAVPAAARTAAARAAASEPDTQESYRNRVVLLFNRARQHEGYALEAVTGSPEFVAARRTTDTCYAELRQLRADAAGVGQPTWKAEFWADRPLPLPESTATELAGFVFGFMPDGDRDGRRSAAELGLGRDTFQRADTDRDGALTQTELADALLVLREPERDALMSKVRHQKTYDRGLIHAGLGAATILPAVALSGFLVNLAARFPVLPYQVSVAACVACAAVPAYFFVRSIWEAGTLHGFTPAGFGAQLEQALAAR